MTDIESIKNELKQYDGPLIRIMEVCGSHTGAIARYGIPGLLSPNIHLVSGPGCPVCVTPSSYIDRLIDLSLTDDTAVCTFGDLLRVPGSTPFNLSQARGQGARVHMVYSPMDVIDLAEKETDKTFVFAAVGFETTTPVYALLVDTLRKKKIRNVRLLTALKTMPEVIGQMMENGAPIDAFLAPGHVAAVTGSDIFVPCAEKYGIPFGVAGFKGEELLIALYGIVRSQGSGRVMNFYPSVVTREGNQKAQELIDTYFEKTDASWRGIGTVPASGRILKEEYASFDAGSRSLNEDKKANKACCCDQVLTGRKKPVDCPLFQKHCTPFNPQGACMVSPEGSCHSWLVNHRTN